MSSRNCCDNDPEYLRLNTGSIGEYYLDGYLPGVLEYVSVDNIFRLKENLENLVDDPSGLQYSLMFHTDENFKKVVPNIKLGLETSWKLLLIMSTIDNSNNPWIKAAIVNRNTGKLALISSTNTKENISGQCKSRALHSLHTDWFIEKNRLSAPPMFWNELINRLRNS